MSETRRYTRWVVEDLSSGAEADIHVQGMWSEEMCRAYVTQNAARWRLMRVDVCEEWTEVAP